MEDCLDGSDEQGCQARLMCNLETDFQCKDGSKCVRKNWMCDNFPDCHDGSDEVNCRESNQKQSAKVKNVISGYKLTTHSELNATQTLDFQSKENGQVQEDKEDTEHEHIWINLLVYSLLSTSIVALLSILIKCKCDKHGGRGGVWVTCRRFGAAGAGGRQDDRIELCQA